MTNFIQSFVPDSFFIISDEETFLWDLTLSGLFLIDQVDLLQKIIWLKCPKINYLDREGNLKNLKILNIFLKCH